VTVKEVGVLEAKTHFSALLDEVTGGAEIVITRHGRPVAKLSPLEVLPRDRRDAVAATRALRDEIARECGIDEEFDWKAAVNEGRP
jgi:prevent-host-death family protein